MEQQKGEQQNMIGSNLTRKKKSSTSSSRSIHRKTKGTAETSQTHGSIDLTTIVGMQNRNENG